MEIYKKNLLSVLVVIFLIVIIFFVGIFLQDGVMIQRDFNFPLFEESFVASHLPLWNNLASQSNIEQLMRLPMRLPFVLMAMVNVSMPIILKLLVFQTFLMMGFSMGLLLYYLSSRRGKPVKYILLIIPLSVMYFLFNPASLQFSWELGLLYNLGTLPLLFLLCLYQDKVSKFKFAFFFSLIVILSIGHPFLLLMNIFFFTAFALFLRKESLGVLVLRLIYSGILIIGLLGWFLLPYLSLNLTSENLGRAANLHRSTFEIVSDNDFFKIFSSSRDKFVIVETAPANDFLKNVHYIALYIVIIVALLPLLLKKRRYQNNNIKKVYFFAVLSFLVCTMLSYGLRSPIGEWYWIFVEKFPLGWMFRSPLKFQLYQALFLTIAFFTSLVLVVTSGGSIFRKKFVVGVATLGVLGSILPGMYDFTVHSMNPIKLPNGFYEVNDYIKTLPGDSKVLWYPKYNESELDWSRGHHIAPFDMKSSVRPSYNMHWGLSHIYDTLYSAVFSYGLFTRENFYDFLSDINVEYIVFHNDRELTIDDATLGYIDTNMDKVFNSGNWYLFKNKIKPKGSIIAYPCLFVTLNSFGQRNNSNCATTSDLAIITKINSESIIIDNNNKEDIVSDFLKREDKIKYLKYNESLSNGWDNHQQASSWVAGLHGYVSDLMQSYENPFYFSETNSSFSPHHIPEGLIEKIILNKEEMQRVDNFYGAWSINLQEPQELHVSGNDIEVISNKRDSVNGWKKLRTPLVGMAYDKTLIVKFNVTQANISHLHVKIVEYDEGGNVIGNEFGYLVKKIKEEDTEINIQIYPRSVNVNKVGVEYWYTNVLREDNTSGELSIENFTILDASMYQQPSTVFLESFELGEHSECELLVKVLYSVYGGNIKFMLNGRDLQDVNTISDRSEYKWIKIKLKKSQAENNVITVRNVAGFNSITKAYVAKTEDRKLDVLNEIADGQQQEFEGEEDIKIQQIVESATYYKLKVKYNKSFVLSLAESFDPSWYAVVNGKKYDSFMVNSTMLGFHIPMQNSEDVTVELIYEPQQKFYTGLVISGTIFIFCVSYLGYDLIRNKRRRKEGGDGEIGDEVEEKISFP